MKKLISTFLTVTMLAIMVPMLASSSSAQTQTRYYRNSGRATSTYKKPSVYRRHRNLINIAIGTGAGAVIGGLLGGKKGALLGTAFGAGGSALYTYKLVPKKRRYAAQYYPRY